MSVYKYNTDTTSLNALETGNTLWCDRIFEHAIDIIMHVLIYMYRENSKNSRKIYFLVIYSVNVL